MSVFINDSGVEKEAKMIYVNDGGVDKLVAGGGVEPDFNVGEIWIPVDFGAFSIKKISYGNGVWVGLGGTSSDELRTSPNLFDWTTRSLPSENRLNDFEYGNGRWVAVGLSGTILTSEDGASWVSRSSGTTNNITTIRFSDGLWIATISSGSGGILTSTDGINWTFRNPLGGVTRDSAYGNGVWMVVGSGIATSTDGINWTSHNSPDFIITNVEFGEETWVVGGYSGSWAHVSNSQDMDNWSEPTFLPNSRRVNDITYGHGLFIVCVGQNGYSSTNLKVFTSVDGNDWLLREDIINSGYSTFSEFSGGVWLLGQSSSSSFLLNLASVRWE